MWFRYSLPVLATLVLSLLPGPARADRRNFVWTYESATMPAGGLELEHYLTAEGNRVAGSYAVDWVHQAEIEYGITDRWDVAMYQVFKQVDSGPLAWGGYKLRARGRFSDPGELPIDPLLYLEWKQGPEGFGFEEKLVLSRRLGDFVLALNIGAEQEAEDWGEGWEIELEPSFAVGYAILPALTVGLEAIYEQCVEFEEGESHWSAPAVFVGPTISVASGRFFWNVGGVWQATQDVGEHPQFMVRSLLGVTL